jgi:predicted small secreted protein
MTKVLTVAATLVLALSMAAPLQASCNTVAGMSTIDVATGNNSTSFITNLAFQNHPGYGTGNYGPYTFSYDPLDPAVAPLSPAASITFWRQGSGDPAVGAGDDNGIYDMIATGGFYYTGYPPSSNYGGYLRGGVLQGSWQPPGIDGCVEASSCMCLLITDQNGSDGQFAILGGRSDATFNSLLSIGGTDGFNHFAPIKLVTLNGPAITGSVRDSGNNDVRVDVTSAAPSGGVYTQDGCACGPAGFKVRQMILPRGNMPPADRDAAGWSEPNLGTGAPQGVTPFGTSVNVLSECGTSDTDVYLATQLVFDSGFGTAVVSANSTRMECGPNIARPGARPQPQLDRPGNQGKPKRR